MTKIPFGIRETLNRIGDLIKIQFGIRETYLNGIRALIATRKAGCAKIWARMRTGKENDIQGGDDKFGMRDCREKEAGMRDQDLPPSGLKKPYNLP